MNIAKPGPKQHYFHSSKKEENSDSDEEELDLEKLKAKMMDDFILPSSPAVKVKCEKSSEEKAAERSAGELSGSDIDSDQDYDSFPLWWVFVLSRALFGLSLGSIQSVYKKPILGVLFLLSVCWVWLFFAVMAVFPTF